MITIYNKIDKSMENTSGFQVVPNASSLDRPFLLCISTKNNLTKSIYGMIREGAQAARVQTTQGIAAGFKLNPFPIDFLGFRFEQDQDYKQAYVELANKFLYPYLIKNGNTFEELKMQARKMNILTYCTGADTYKGAEDRLEVLLERDGYSDEEIHEILSQVSLVAMESMLETAEMHATSISFVDVNDSRMECQKVISYRELLDQENRRILFSPLGNSNSVLYIYKGNGVHRIKHFFADNENIAKPSLCAIVSMLLECSLNGEEVDRTMIMNRLNEYTNEDVSVSELLDRLDEELSYNNAPRYTKDEGNIKLELDAAYKILRKTNEMFINTLEEKQGQDIRLRNVVRGLYEFSSDVTFQQVLTYARMWYIKEGNELLSIPSDRQVRAVIIDDEASV